MDKQEALKRFFGFSSFREGQEEIVEAVLSGRDVVGIMPTGAGKSVCFQVPALLFPGITIVVSPLISLMKDQVNALTQNGIRAAYLNRSLTSGQYYKALQNARQGIYKIIYVAPERLLTEEFLDFAQKAEISMLTIDEAHCVSQWGQDFRPGYLSIADFLDALPTRPVVSAFTATATPKVREDIVKLLGLTDPYVLLTGFDRKNLYFEVRKPSDKQRELLNLLKEWRGKSGIVYCSTRKTVEAVCDSLCSCGIAATRYHAGLPDWERKQNQEHFLLDQCSVMVATNAFGMGIDKSNISYVIHYNMPKDPESYYQEAGRAGRDGSPASCVLLYSGQDVVTNRFLIENSQENEQLSEEQAEEVLRLSRERLKAMTFYCTTGDCLRAYLLRYFGETNAPGYCGNCFNCNHLFEELDVSVEAQKILSCVKRTGERYGIKTIVDTLRGSNAEKILRLGLNTQSTFGLLRQEKESRLREIIHFLILNAYLVQTDGEYPVLRLGEKASGLLRERTPLLMKLKKEETKKGREPVQKGTGAHKRPELFEQLRDLRTKLAARQGVPAYVIFSDAALEDMCERLPQTQQEFLLVNGVGRLKLERYGNQFLQILRYYIQNENSL